MSAVFTSPADICTGPIPVTTLTTNTHDNPCSLFGMRVIDQEARREFSLLSSIFNMAIREDVTDSNPCVKISKKVREKILARNKRERFMSLEEEDDLFALGLLGIRERLRPVVKLGIHLGTRLGELMAIKRDDINLGPDSFFVRLRSKGQDLKVEVRPNHVLIPKSKNGKP